MRFAIIVLILTTTIATARADFVIKQKVESAIQSGDITLRIKGDKIRIDMALGPMGDVSVIMDLNAGDMITLMHKHKVAAKISGAQMKEKMEVIKKAAEKAAAQPKPQDTGKTEKVGAYNAEIYTWSSTNGTKATMWVAKDFPNYRQIKEQLKRLSELGGFGPVTKMGPEESDLPGMVVKTETEAFGQKMTTTLVSAKEEPVDAAVFEAPNDYTDMTQPTTTEMKQKREEMAADMQSWLQKQPVTPEMKQRAAEAQKAQAALTAGTKFPDFNEKDLDGKPLSIANYKGKVVLIDFWATWCGPCVRELPNALKTYEKHHGDGFEIIGISLDSSRQNLESFLKQKNMTWQQFFDGNGWENKLAVKYGIQSIPATYLLDGEGKIVATNLRGENLEQAVANALAKR